MLINWYPGHMAKTTRQIKETISLADVVVEVLDARIPISSRNPNIDELAAGKPRIIILNKSDIADDSLNKLWKEHFEEMGHRVLLLDSLKGRNVKIIVDIAKDMTKEKTERLLKKGRISVPLRLMILGIPNVGKSTIINKLAGKQIAQTADKPGVTKSNRWIKIGDNIDMMDTPGILWPKFEDENVGMNLAFIGSVKDEILNIEELAYYLIKRLKPEFSQNIVDRYGLGQEDIEDMDENDIIELIARKKGCLMSGGRINTIRVSTMILDDFRGMRLGKITLERPEEQL